MNLNQLINVFKSVENRINNIKNDDDACSGYLGDDDIIKLRDATVKYNQSVKRSAFTLHAFDDALLFNNLINIKKVMASLKHKLAKDKQTGDVDNAIKVTHEIDTINGNGAIINGAIYVEDITNFINNIRGVVPEDLVADVMNGDSELIQSPEPAIIAQFAHDALVTYLLPALTKVAKAE